MLCTPPAADFGPGLEVAAEGYAAGRGVCFLRLSPPISGQARRRRRREAQLDRVSALYASCRRLRARPGGSGGGGCGWIGVCSLRLSPLRLRAWPGGGGRRARSWTGSLLSTPLAADSGPGTEAEGGPTRRAGPAEAASEEHLLLLRIATASGLP